MNEIVKLPLFPKLPWIFKLNVNVHRSIPKKPDTLRFGAKRHPSNSDTKGKRNENEVEKYLKKLASLGALQTFFKIDTNGNDFLIIKNNGRVQPLQVKSSQIGVDKHKAKYPKIPAIIVSATSAWKKHILEIIMKKKRSQGLSA